MNYIIFILSEDFNFFCKADLLATNFLNIFLRMSLFLFHF